MAEKEDTVRKDEAVRREDTVRKVFVLPAELMDRINHYKIENGLDSEVEAVRRLLDAALLHRDNTVSILHKMLNRYNAEKDIRILARDVLSTHPLVDSIQYFANQVNFTVRDDLRGIFTKGGRARVIYHDDTIEDVEPYKIYDLDDDIPF